jgi:hypothetical protein
MYDGDEAQRGAVKLARSSWGPKTPALPTGSACGTSLTTLVRGPGTLSRTREFVHSLSPHGLGLVQLLDASG